MCEGGGNHDVKVDRRGGSDVGSVGSVVFVILVDALVCCCRCCGVWKNLFDERGVPCYVFDDSGKFVSDGIVSGIAVRAKRALERVEHIWCHWFIAASCVGAALTRMGVESRLRFVEAQLCGDGKVVVREWRNVFCRGVQPGTCAGVSCGKVHAEF